MSFALALWLVPAIGHAVPAPDGAGEPAATSINAPLVPRTVLALFDSRSQATPTDTQIHELAEMPLNFLGYKIDYWDIGKGFPELDQRPDVIGVLAWFDEPVADELLLLQWLLSASDAGRKLILIGELGVAANWAQQTLADAVFARLGLSASGETVEVTYDVMIESLDKDVFGFERRLSPPFPPFPIIHSTGPDIDTHLVMSLPNHAEKSSVLVATGPNGGFVAANYVIYYEPTINRMKWLINPFAFFDKALGARMQPVPDVTTVSGRRLYFSHIDGDGWNNVSEIEEYRATGTTSAEVVLKDFIEPYGDLPVTVGLIGGDVDPDVGGTLEATTVAQRLFALPQVEVAAHTYTHPFNWDFYEAYDRSRELSLIDRVFSDERNLIRKYLNVGGTVAGHSHVEKKFVSGSDELPRVYMKEAFSLAKEIGGAIRQAEALAPPEKHVMAYLWSGDTNPFEAALAAARQAGVKNINGGDSRFDTEWPSVAYVPPIARTVGRERQIYAVNSNENTYTNDWTGPFYGQAFLTETIANTETPRRLKGINLYYHMYAGEKPASHKAIRTHLNRIRTASVTPVAASHYAGIAEGFFSARIYQIGPAAWRVLDRGTLNTLRVDHHGGRIVDLDASRGVIGFTYANGALYVALDSAAPVVELHLLDAANADIVGRSAWLVDSRWIFSSVKRSPCGLEARVAGYGRGELTVGGLRSGSYSLSLADDDRVIWRGEAVAKANGFLSVTMPADARQGLHLKMACPQ